MKQIACYLSLKRKKKSKVDPTYPSQCVTAINSLVLIYLQKYTWISQQKEHFAFLLLDFTKPDRRLDEKRLLSAYFPALHADNHKQYEIGKYKNYYLEALLPTVEAFLSYPEK